MAGRVLALLMLLTVLPVAEIVAPLVVDQAGTTKTPGGSSDPLSAEGGCAPLLHRCPCDCGAARLQRTSTQMSKPEVRPAALVTPSIRHGLDSDPPPVPPPIA